MNLYRQARDTLKRAARDSSGAIAPMFGVMFALLIVPAVGVSIDLSRARTGRGDLQDALDATALALARMPQTTSQADLQKAANAWMAANLHDKNLQNLQVTATATYGGATNTVSTIALNATSNVGSIFTGQVGQVAFGNYPVAAASTTTWGVTHTEIALVLDNTGSMNSNNKIQTLISSANQLVSTLFSQTPDAKNSLKIAVVPFSQTVNVGSQYQNAAWITGVLPTGYATALQAAYPGITFPYGQDIFSTAGVDRFQMFAKMSNQTWGGCVESRPAPYDAQDTAPSPGTPATMFVPYFAPDEPDFLPYQGQNYDEYPNNYIADVPADAGQAWTVQQGDKAKYTGATSRGGADGLGASAYTRGPNAGCALAPILRLTNDQTAITNEINKMVAIGDTNLNIGMVWGWHVLSPNAPFADGVAYGTQNVQKIIVFLTDGWNEATPTGTYNGVQLSNNESYYSGIGYIWQNRVGVGAGSSQSNRSAALDARTQAVCSNINTKGITVYTVRIDVAGSQSPAVLQNCASTPDKFYDVPNVSNLPAAFAKIAGSIGALRVSK